MLIANSAFRQSIYVYIPTGKYSIIWADKWYVDREYINGHLIVYIYASNWQVRMCAVCNSLLMFNRTGFENEKGYFTMPKFLRHRGVISGSDKPINTRVLQESFRLALHHCVIFTATREYTKLSVYHQHPMQLKTYRAGML